MGGEGSGWQEMRIAADTNVLVRAAVRDDAKQSDSATRLLGRAEIVAIAVSSLCEFVWVLSGVYRFRSDEIATAIRKLLVAENVETNGLAVEAGLAMLDAGGDFADGAIAYEGRSMGGETFVSFDEGAVKMLSAQGQAARHL
jgi:predicted nucleic-acid-binding protein